MIPIDEAALIAAALQAQTRAYAPFSRYRVGAAVQTASGAVYTGCNVEVSSFSLTCCAERVAVFKAVSEGERAMVAVAVVTDDDPPGSPCGACRQVLSDFGGPELIVLTGNPQGATQRARLGELLPGAFRPEGLLARMHGAG